MESFELPTRTELPALSEPQVEARKDILTEQHMQVREIAAYEAGIGVMAKAKEAFLKNVPEQQRDLAEKTLNAKLEPLASKMRSNANQLAGHMNESTSITYENPLKARTRIIETEELEKSLIKNIENAFIETSKEITPDTQITTTLNGRVTTNETPSLETMKLKKEFSFEQSKWLSNLNSDRKTTTARYNIGEKTFTEKTARMDMPKFLQGQRALTLKETTDPEKQKELKEQVKLQEEQSKHGVWRSSKECKHFDEQDRQGKLHLASNPHIEVVEGGGEKVIFGRAGALTDFSDLSTNLNEMGKDSANFEKRKAIVQDMALGSICSQAAFRMGEKIDPDSFAMSEGKYYFSQISLLHNKGKEVNMQEDMRFIFTALEGKDMIFDGQCGMDSEGKIHVPQEVYVDTNGKPYLDAFGKPSPKDMVPNEAKPLTQKLETNFSNFDVGVVPVVGKDPKGHHVANRAAKNKLDTKANKYEGFLNTKGKTDELKAFQAKRAEMERLYKDDPQSTKAIGAVADLEMMMGTNVTFNCKSAKDRTSRVVRRVVRNLMERALGSKITEKEREEIKYQAAERGCSNEIARQNATIPFLKQSSLILPARNAMSRFMQMIAYGHLQS